MGLFSRWREERRAETIKIDDALMRAILNTEAISKEKALQIPTVAGGIDLIAGIIASTPIKLYKELDGKAEEVKADPRLRLLNDETGDTLNANEFWRAMVRDYYVGKGAYAYIHKERGRYKSLHYVDEARVAIIMNNDPIYKDYNINVNGKQYKPYEFLKLLRNTKDGATGTPITVESSELLKVAYKTLKFEEYLINKGGNKKGFLQSDRKLTEEAMQELRSAFANMYNGTSDNAIVLNNGVKFQESSSSAVELQLNENKTTNAAEFAKLFHISPELMSGNGADTAAVAKLAAIPLMISIQCALNRDLLLEKEKGTLYFAFDTKELLKGDIKSRYEAYKTALDANFMQIDEVRFAEDMEPLGLTWIKLGLNDVLYEPHTKQIYTPNTNATTVLQERAASDILELRYNPNHGSKGRFAEGGGSAIDSNGRNFATFYRRPARLILSDEQIEDIKRDIVAIGADMSHFVFNAGNQTSYDDEQDVVYVRGDVMPDTYSTHPRAQMSARATLAHEYYGHRNFRNTKFEMGSWRDEFRASYFAAINTPNLSIEDRRDLMLDAKDRARAAGVKIRDNAIMRRIIYGQETYD